MKRPHDTGGLASERDLVAVDRTVRATIRVLLVDDERSLRESCASLLQNEGYDVTVVGRGDDALRMVRTQQFDIVVVDLYLARASGMEILQVVTKESPDSLVIVMTSNPSVESSLAALRSGAWDYLPKPFSATHFEILLGRAAHAVMVGRESIEQSSQAPDGADAPGSMPIYGGSKALAEVVELARRVAPTNASVFLTGESGTGKEVLAHFIHENSRRRARELVPLNCAAIPEALLESEMFGHVEGAFTGAVREKRGLLEVANGGSLFLDELTELPLPTQAKLLRVLQDGVIRRVGSTTTDAVVDVRFIAATNVDPAAAIREGRLREDLHYRLRVVPIHIPPLRERPEDVPVLAAEFLKELWDRHRDHGATPPTFSDEALEVLTKARWPGNVRELRNVVEHLVVMADPGTDIRSEDIVFIDHHATPAQRHDGSPRMDVFALDYHDAREAVLAEFEVAYLTHVVRSSSGNISDAARIAGVDRTTLYRIMEKHGIERDSLLDAG